MRADERSITKIRLVTELRSPNSESVQDVFLIIFRITCLKLIHSVLSFIPALP